MSIRAGILYVPDFDEESGRAVRILLHQVISDILILEEANAQSQFNWIEEILTSWCDEREFDLILTIGGTMPAPGLAPMEIMPEVTAAVVERLLPGFGEAMRSHARQQSALALLDRSLAGIRGRTLIVNLPAGAGPAQLFLEAVVSLIEPVLTCLREGQITPNLADTIEGPSSGSPPIDFAHDNVEAVDISSAPSKPEKPASLNAEEFAQFLRRRSTGSR